MNNNNEHSTSRLCEEILKYGKQFESSRARIQKLNGQGWEQCP